MAQKFFLKEPAPTKVQIVNPDGTTEVITAKIDNLPLTTDGNAIRIQILNSTIQGISASSPSSYVVTFDNILVLNADGGFAALPMNTTLYNVSQSQLDTALANIKSAYATLVSASASATLHYCRFNSSKLVESFSYDLKGA